MTGRKDGSTRYFVEVMTPRWRHYVMWRIYHWYDMRIPMRIPGWKRFENLLRRLGAEIRLDGFDDAPRLRDRPLSWPINQDIRCFYLSEKARESILMLSISEEQYDEIRKAHNERY